MTTMAALNDWVFLLARVLFGGVLTFMAIDGFRRLEPRINGARSNGVPFPQYLVPVATGLLLVGGLGTLFWVYPRLAALALAAFFLGVTPVMHAFWKEEPEDRRGQRTQFLKNSAMFAGALLFFYVANS